MRCAEIMEQERINANVNSLSQRLLEGCKLLSESCPETNVPLVSTQDGRMYSVGNGCYYVREGSELVKAQAEPPPAAPPATPGGSPARSAFLAPSMNAPGTVEAPPPGPPENGQSLSSRVAAKLLEGFTLLSESCPVTSVPLVQDAQGRILSVGTGRWYERTGGDLIESYGAPAPAAALVPQSMAQPPQPSHAMPPPPPPAFRGYSANGGTPVAPTPNTQHHHWPGTPVAFAPLAAAQYQPPSSPYQNYGGSGAAVASAVLQAAGTPALPRAPTGGASLKASSQEAVAVLTSRLAEATAALADAPIREAGPYVVMVKDIALAISALKAV